MPEETLNPPAATPIEHEGRRVVFRLAAGRVRRAVRYAFHDWTREMRPAARIATWTGILLQGFAIYAGLTRSLVWPLHWPAGVSLWVTVWLLYVVGSGVTNGMLTAEFTRKTQLESDLAAARQIQRTLNRRR
jgi:hypothetical protein